MTNLPNDEPDAVGTDSFPSGSSSQSSSSSDDSNRTLAIALSTTFSVLAVVLIVGSIIICCRNRHVRMSFGSRGVTPIDDEEIESWKRKDDTDLITDEKTNLGHHNKHASSGSIKKPLSVVVYQNTPHVPDSKEEVSSPRSFTFNAHSRTKSIEVPQTPVLARAPNARPGLTDETIQGDDAFLPCPKRRPSRLYKYPPNSSVSSTRGHGRNLSSRSSISVGGSLRDQWYGQGYGYHTDTDLSPRSSNDHLAYYYSFHGQHMPSRHSSEKTKTHNRVYSTSSVPPRMSLEEDYLGGLSPRPLIRQADIGRAIG